MENKGYKMKNNKKISYSSSLNIQETKEDIVEGRKKSEFDFKKNKKIKNKNKKLHKLFKNKKGNPPKKKNKKFKKEKMNEKIDLKKTYFSSKNESKRKKKLRSKILGEQNNNILSELNSNELIIQENEKKSKLKKGDGINNKVYKKI